MRAAILIVLGFCGCVAPFTLLETEEQPEPQVIIIERGEFVPPPAESVEVDPPRPVRHEPDGGGGRSR